MLLEQIQSTAALLLVYTAFILWHWENDIDNHVVLFIAWVFFYTLAASAVVFFATTLMRIWM